MRQLVAHGQLAGRCVRVRRAPRRHGPAVRVVPLVATQLLSHAQGLLAAAAANARGPHEPLRQASHGPRSDWTGVRTSRSAFGERTSRSGACWPLLWLASSLIHELSAVHSRNEAATPDQCNEPTGYGMCAVPTLETKWCPAKEERFLVDFGAAAP
eukprot:5328906-Pleurochrysis_carterae.AAC.2